MLNVDETRHKDSGKLLWTWCFRADLFTLFRIDPSRGSDVLVEVLGEEFDGVLGCDYFGAYRKYMKDFGVVVQFCLAHLIREVKFLTTLSDQVTKNYGERLLERLRALFRVIHRRERMTEEQFQLALERERDRMLQVGKRAPDRIETQKLARRFRKHGAAYFRFITTPGLEPTNNLAYAARGISEVIPRPGLCRVTPMRRPAARRISGPGRGRSRHNQRPSRKASRLSVA